VRLLSHLLEGLNYNKLLKAYSHKGRKPAVHPKTLFKIIAYAYMNNIYQSRVNQYEGTRDFVAVVGSGQIEVKTMLKTGEMLEILTPEGKLVEVEWPEMYRDGEKVFEAHPNWIVTADLGVAVPEMSLVRRKVAGSAHTD
jgi:hypothetical protein